jgi:hypothetical protein
VAHPPAGPGAPERAGHLDRHGAARPRHHRRAARLCATPVRAGGGHRWALVGRIHAGGDGRRTAREYAGAVGMVPVISDRLPRAPCGFSARRGVAGGAGRPSPSTRATRLKADRRALKAALSGCATAPSRRAARLCGGGGARRMGQLTLSTFPVTMNLFGQRDGRRRSGSRDSRSPPTGAANRKRGGALARATPAGGTHAPNSGEASKGREAPEEPQDGEARRCCLELRGNRFAAPREQNHAGCPSPAKSGTRALFPLRGSEEVALDNFRGRSGGRPLEQRRTSGGKAGNSTFATPGALSLPASSS